jgi:hypothetical protein
MKQKAIGEVFEANGKRYCAVEAHGRNCCHFCAFNSDEIETARLCVGSVCEARHRHDETEVRFKEVK